MIIGLFGLSGSGKSTLSSQLVNSLPKFVNTKASKLIADSQHTILLNDLDREVVGDNQDALILGFDEFCKNNIGKNIIIEVHNVIETKSEAVEVDNDVFLKLKLDGACFISVDPSRLFHQRLSDLSRTRFNVSIENLAKLQNKSLSIFESLQLNEKLIIKSDYHHQLENFIRRIDHQKKLYRKS